MASSSATFSTSNQPIQIDRSTVIVGQSNIGNLSATNGSTQEDDDAEDARAGYFALCEDIFMYGQPLKEGTGVYKGFQKFATGQTEDVAIKMIFPCTQKNMREAEHLVTLKPHPNIVEILRSRKIKAPGVFILYIIMELCGSETLRDYCKNTLFDFHQIMYYCKQLLNGIKHIHENRIIHGDLKPENILLSSDRKSLKVSDFGISKRLRSGRSKTKCTSQGTDNFRAPETFDSDEISMSADIYSSGVTLFSMFTNGGHPFGKDPDLHVYNMKRNTGLDLTGLPAKMEESLKCEFRDLLEKMLQFDPKTRPTIHEVLNHRFFEIALAASEGKLTDKNDLTIVDDNIETSGAREAENMAPDNAAEEPEGPPAISMRGISGSTAIRSGASQVTRDKAASFEQLDEQERRVGGQAQLLLEMFIMDRLQRDEELLNHRSTVRNAVRECVIQEEKGTHRNEDDLEEISMALRELGEQLSEDFLLNRLIDTVAIHSPKDVFMTVCRQLFEDGQFNWGRVVALFYFAYRLIARAVTESLISNLLWIKEIFNWTIEYFVVRYANWIIQRGGWEAIREHWVTASGGFTALIIGAALTVAYVWWKQP